MQSCNLILSQIFIYSVKVLLKSVNRNHLISAKYWHMSNWSVKGDKTHLTIMESKSFLHYNQQNCVKRKLIFRRKNERPEMIEKNIYSFDDNDHIITRNVTKSLEFKTNLGLCNTPNLNWHWTQYVSVKFILYIFSPQKIMACFCCLHEVDFTC